MIHTGKTDMRKTGKNPTYGLTLIEVMIAIVIIIVAVLGSVLYRYHSALGARKADVNMTAARIGLLLLETWEGSGGGLDYNPVTIFNSQLTISNDSGPDFPSGFTKLWQRIRS